jgi:hypothetical protein
MNWTLQDQWLLFLAALSSVILARQSWLRSRGELTPFSGWTTVEHYWRRISAWAFTAAGLVSLAVAAYAASRVPWTGDLARVIGDHATPQVRPHLAQSTFSYLFGGPVSLIAGAVFLTDPWFQAHAYFRGPRELVLRLLPIAAVAGTIYSISTAITALSAVL